MPVERRTVALSGYPDLVVIYLGMGVNAWNGRWARSEPHRIWWQRFLRDTGGTGFWHETYFARGGMEAIYDDLPKPIGMMKFAPLKPARGPMFSARTRAGRDPAGTTVPILSEDDLYGPPPQP
jgi:hypothetical protein